MNSATLALTILGMAGVTVFSRLFPTLFVEKYSPGPRMTRWLEQVPAAVMSAIVFRAMLVPKGHLDLSFHNKALWVGLVTILIAIFSKNFYITIIGGISTMIVASLLLT